jgi:formylglycine-generating enzyme required for sulfatase activity
LGPDPDSGLYEFAHVVSGPIPVRDAATRRLVLSDGGFAIVLVLIPGGTFYKGAQKSDPAGRNFDPAAEESEGPVWPVTLSPYFLSKYECTQAQWSALTTGENPSSFQPGGTYGGRAMSGRNPVEQVTWDDCATWFPRYGLILPSEAQWECACRAGTDTPWPTGAEAGSLQGAANCSDAYAKHHGGPPNWWYSEEIDDGHLVHAPVGSFAANAFGLHDTIGNVSEWCLDKTSWWTAQPPKDPVVEGVGDRVARGGSWSDRASRVRSASRAVAAPGLRLNLLGTRPARRVE